MLGLKLNHVSKSGQWIDHVASSDYDLKHISRCHIMPHMPCNVSDHLPVICVIKVNISPTKATTCDSSYVGCRPPPAHPPPPTPHIKWDSSGVKEKYIDYLESKLHDLCLASFRNRIGCFCTNGINLWNVLFDGTAQLVNPLECIEERSRAICYLQRCLIYSLMNYSLNSLHVMQVFALVMTNSTLLHTQMMSIYSALLCQACSD